MEPAPLKLRLAPLPTGSSLQLLISGPVPTALEVREIRRLLTLLARWSGRAVQVEVAFSVDDPAGWFDWWSDGLCDVPARDLEVRFRPRPRIRRAGGPGDR